MAISWYLFIASGLLAYAAVARALALH